jgi:CRP/FNR family transcriptional regulator
MARGRSKAGAASARVRCTVCTAQPLCLEPVCGEASRLRRQELSLRHIAAAKGAALFRANMPMRALYVVRSGLIKTCVRDSQGIEQVIGFHIPGEIVGFDGIASGRHVCAGIPIVDSEICQLPMSRLGSLVESDPGLHGTISRLMARELAGRRLQLMLFRGRADQRVAWFLLDIAERTAQTVNPHTVIQLGMSRSEIGSMLGMQIETVSRMLRELNRNGLIAVTGRRITLLDPAGLRALLRQRLSVSSRSVSLSAR